MATPHHTPLAPAGDLDRALAMLRERGLRVSAARRLLLAALFAAERPLSAEELAAGAGGQLPPADVASTYRNLDVLEAAGLVRHFHAGHGPALYVLARDHGDLLICERCGTRRLVDPGVLEPVRAMIRAQLGFEARFGHFPMAGLCERCAALTD